jgi:hypothetical protein
MSDSEGVNYTIIISGGIIVLIGLTLVASNILILSRAIQIASLPQMAIDVLNLLVNAILTIWLISLYRSQRDISKNQTDVMDKQRKYSEEQTKIMDKQRKISETQNEIMESQQNLMELEYQPRIIVEDYFTSIDKHDSGSTINHLNLELINVGRGAATDLHLYFDFTSDDKSAVNTDVSISSDGGEKKHLYNSLSRLERVGTEGSESALFRGATLPGKDDIRTKGPVHFDASNRGQEMTASISLSEGIDILFERGASEVLFSVILIYNTELDETETERILSGSISDSEDFDWTDRSTWGGGGIFKQEETIIEDVKSRGGNSFE